MTPLADMAAIKVKEGAMRATVLPQVEVALMGRKFMGEGPLSILMAVLGMA